MLADLAGGHAERTSGNACANTPATWFSSSMTARCASTPRPKRRPLRPGLRPRHRRQTAHPDQQPRPQGLVSAIPQPVVAESLLDRLIDTSHEVIISSADHDFFALNDRETASRCGLEPCWPDTATGNPSHHDLRRTDATPGNDAAHVEQLHLAMNCSHDRPRYVQPSVLSSSPDTPTIAAASSVDHPAATNSQNWHCTDTKDQWRITLLTAKCCNHPLTPSRSSSRQRQSR